MKRFLLILSIMMLVLCLGVCLVACGGGGDENPPAGTGTGTATGETNGGNTDTSITYTVTVVDQLGNPIEGVNLQVCHGEGAGSCLRAGVTDANGIKTYSVKEALVSPRVLINSAPENSVYSSEYIYFDEGKTEITVTVELKSKYTFSAGNEDGTVKYSGVKFFIYTSGEGSVLAGQCESDENGVAAAVVDPGEYYIVVEHPNDAFVLKNGTNGNIVTNIEGFAFNAVFEETTENIDYVVFAKDTDDAPVAGVIVRFFSDSFTYLCEDTTDENGKATVSLPNGKYYASAVCEDKSASAVVFEKNQSNEGESVVTNSKPGTFKSNAIMLLNSRASDMAKGEYWFYVPDAENYKIVVSEDSRVTVSTTDGTVTGNTIVFDKKDGYFKLKVSGDHTSVTIERVEK